MNEYLLKTDDFTLRCFPETASFAVTCGEYTWQTRPDAALETPDGSLLPFDGHLVSCSPYHTGTLDGFRASYDFGGLRADTVVAAEGKTLRCELRVRGDEQGQLERVFWPAAMEFDLPEGEGYTVLPIMHGSMIPTRWPGEIRSLDNGMTSTRDAYLPFYGQVRRGAGFCLIWDDADDAGILHGHIPGGKTEPRPFWASSLGRIGCRALHYRFFASGADYNAIAKCYRAFAKASGHFVSLREKIARNPNVGYLIGAPVLHAGICIHISPKSNFYDPERPEDNDHVTPFSAVGEGLEKLHARGLERVYLHLDGWGAHGYDNLHPDVFPPCEAAGGAAGMRGLSDTCARLGYRFGIHDQYRDYYYDASSFDRENAVRDIHGGNPYCSVWYGGEQTVLCARLAREYVRRNYNEFERLGIRIDGSYLDVFSIVPADECFHPDHPMTRTDCFRYRGECLEELTARGIIPSSEEATDALLPHLALVHHAPLPCLGFEGEKLAAAGIPIPLLSLVYHECVVIPWSGANGSLGGWSIPGDISPFLYALMTGGTVYVSPDDSDETLERVRFAIGLQARLWDKELVRHEFLDGGFRRQRTTFSDGTTVTVDFDSGEYSASWSGQNA